MFGRNKEATPDVQANMESEAGSKRERPDYAALAQQRSEALSQKVGSKWERIKGAFRKGKDFVLTLDSRIAYRAGQAKDLGVAGAEAVGEGFVRGKQAVDRAGSATLDFAVDKAALVVEPTKEAGRYLVKKGQEGAERAMNGIRSGIESAQNRYQQTRAGITEKYQKTRDTILTKKDYVLFKAEEVKRAQFMKRSAELTEKARLSGLKMDQIYQRAQQRLEAKGISNEESELSAAA